MYKKIGILLIVLFLVMGIVSGCGNDDTENTTEETSAKNEDKSITIGTKPMTEQYIIGEMIKLLVEENTDINVEMKTGIAGGTSNLHPALTSGEIDLYPEYTGTGWMFVLKNDLIEDPDEMYEETKKAYEEEFDVIWLDQYGFNNTYTLAIDGEKAKELNIKTYSDLANKSDELTFGAEYDFYERDDGYNELVEEYGLNFKNTKEMDIGLKYKAIESKEVDVINAFSTDGLLDEYKLKVLEDDKNFFPSYYATTIVRKETLDKYPELKEVLNKLGGQISEEEIRKLNNKVEGKNEEPKDVAEEFLKEKGLL
ncbi:glycine/betaine ABC transporter substrate-binding protein [Clostridium sp. D2Q-11]|uniref:Glycine/betaine ABC transporter substrate-binding protein n=1 Tax=Anaeromonas frigoriresistens TaxID=2683708 RepID=A0A942UQW4_9FIRM|nr:glycine betaine ABC transporter substrate-binding protein [Anaeromonas frigoriresistens]MBS4537614.1 glycine/betaine ABC transporter substrate-binding protein [Anaeromonas frigoriresistens]